MENTAIIILTIIVSLLFMAFIIGTYREFSLMNNTAFSGGEEKGPRAVMVQFLQKIFTDENIEPGKKNELLDIMKKTFDDMDTVKKTSSENK
ncbi:MAG: hypothetical protein FJY20_10670 [Bacteroidetes bacterium]|nr:hypothetical protein [Bacteroidota bacterium]